MALADSQQFLNYWTLGRSTLMENGNQRLVAAGFIYSEGFALIARHAMSKSIAPGQLHLPGGHVEAGEHPAAALCCREIEKEFGVLVQAMDPLHTFEYEEIGYHTRGIVYAAALIGPPSALRLDPVDHSEILRVGREHLDELFPDKTNHNYVAAIKGFAYFQDSTVCDQAAAQTHHPIQP